jgi:hypothetical protein
VGAESFFRESLANPSLGSGGSPSRARSSGTAAIFLNELTKNPGHKAGASQFRDIEQVGKVPPTCSNLRATCPKLISSRAVCSCDDNFPRAGSVALSIRAFPRHDKTPFARACERRTGCKTPCAPRLLQSRTGTRSACADRIQARALIPASPATRRVHGRAVSEDRLRRS